MQRVLRPGGLLGFYVWDYPGGEIGFIDAFWKAAADIDPRAAALDESRRFPFCTRPGLLALCRAAGLPAPVIEPIETQIMFRDFDSFWLPFTLGAGAGARLLRRAGRRPPGRAEGATGPDSSGPAVRSASGPAPGRSRRGDGAEKAVGQSSPIRPAPVRNSGTACGAKRCAARKSAMR